MADVKKEIVDVYKSDRTQTVQVKISHIYGFIPSITVAVFR